MHPRAQSLRHAEITGRHQVPLINHDPIWLRVVLVLHMLVAQFLFFQLILDFLRHVQVVGVLQPSILVVDELFGGDVGRGQFSGVVDHVFGRALNLLHELQELLCDDCGFTTAEDGLHHRVHLLV